MEIIDIHAHIYPESIAKKAVKNIGLFYSIDMDCDGTSDVLIESGKKINVKNYVVHSAATVPQQVSNINKFILAESQKHPEFIPFGTLHADLSKEEIETEVDFLLKNGFKGIKIHPDFQKFDIDGENSYKMYKILDGALPILFHVGDKRYDYSAPKRLYKTCKDFPKQKFIGAHFGGYSKWDEVKIYDDIMHLDNLYFDTSSSLDFLDKDLAKSLINRFGSHKFFWGSDFPMWTHCEELNRFLSLNLSDKDNEKILSLNAKEFLNI
jgi:predicted TIM-barrel fold metal-dependent hydrolase